jgi:hypothetical protein
MAIAKDKFAKVADRLLNNTFKNAQGQGVFIKSGGYNPTTDTTTAATQLSVPVTMVNFKQSQVDGQRVRQGDRKIIIEESALGDFEIDVDLTDLDYTGPKDTDTLEKLIIVDKTEYPFKSIVVIQVRDR